MWKRLYFYILTGKMYKRGNGMIDLTIIITKNFIT